MDYLSISPIIIVAVCFFIGVYLIPSIIALRTEHKNSKSIIALNILLGWTFWGWLAIFVWSLFGKDTKVSSTTN
ncbi:superinfection immunity protein [Salipaludibacillus sp. CF4.18]|uniref:superinfection immunity protein n=1 Tax=Salipaludibacillus sp. CF4.18 TaxID=3373081 RepID=UPI003EE66301